MITAPTEISLMFTVVQAPLGLIMLGLVVLVTVFFLGFVVYLQASVLIDTRRHARELEAQRQLADQAEASRFTDLRTFLADELKAMNERLGSAEEQLKRTVEESGNTLAAYIGELEDRLATGGRQPGAGTGTKG